MDPGASTSTNKKDNEQTLLSDDEIEKICVLFKNCHEVCSQSEFHEESQSLVVESQSDEPQVPVKLDFQAEFLRSMGLDSNDISQIASHKRSNTEHKLDSQTDVEVIMTAYMIDKSFQNQGNTPKPMNWETFMDSHGYFLTKKNGINNERGESVEKKRSENIRARIFTLGPLVLQIEDILKIPTDCHESETWTSYQTIFGQPFKTVMFYGRCELIGGRSDTKIYEVDDGSEVIIVHYQHNNTKRDELHYEAQQLIEEYRLAQTNGISCLGENFHPSDPLCKKLMGNLEIIMNVIQRNTEIEDCFTPGHKVIVIGRVFGHTDGTKHVFAYDMIEDGGRSRDFEINFKEHLINLYRTKYQTK